MSDAFTHLHVHTEYSMLDGAAQHAPLFEEAERLGQPALAMTDHGNMFGAYSFYTQAKKTSVKPILGIEAYVAPQSRFHKKPVRWGEPSQRDDDISGNGAYTHMTMLARTPSGLRNLFILSSRGSVEGYYHKPRMDRDLISEHAEGIIATTGCPSGEVQTLLRLGQFEKAVESAATYREIFGKENYFLELMDHDNAIEKRVRVELRDLAKKLNLAPVVTNDSHYVTADQKDAHAALLCVQSGSTLDDPRRFKFDGEGYYLRSASEMYAVNSDELWREGCRNTLTIAERVESYDPVFTHRDLMPQFAVPEGYTAESWLHHEVMKGLQRLFPQGVPGEYTERAEYELRVINEQGFPGYFLVTADLCNWARNNGIWVGPGRGSAVGSLVAYAVGITAADPLEHGLLFERFLNPERISMPDIDIDFDDRRRGEMLTYVAEKYGSDKIAQVVTFGTIKAKAALKDAARILHGSEGFAIADKISKAMPPAVLGKDISLTGIVDEKHERYNEAVEVRSLLDRDATSKKIFETARGLEGLIRQPGVHACAVIMSSEPIQRTIPVWARPDGSVITGFDYPSCEDIGLLKMDFLGLRNLTVLSDAIELVRVNRGESIDLASLTMDNAAAYELLGRGDTLGVFQLDGAAMRELLRRMQPTNFNDIAAVLALYRPGPMGVNAHNDYADRKNGRQQVTPIHPELKEPLRDILAETHGLIVYQEQIMKIAQKVAGFTPGQADILRKAMGKKKLEVLEEQYQRFEEGMKQNKFSHAAIKTLWDTILPFAGYAFNKSHAVGYGLVSYWTAFMKANYTPEYMAALLTSVGDSKDKMAMYLAECRKLGVHVLSPDVNESLGSFAAVDEDIRFGLGAIRNVGTNVVNSIVERRRDKGSYADFTDFLSKVDPVVCNKRAIESLVKAGAFDGLNHPRKALHDVHEQAVDAVLGVKKEEAKGQYDLFGALSEENAPTLGADIVISDREWETREKLTLEREMLGLYVSSHPLDGYHTLLEKNRNTAIVDLLNIEELKDSMHVYIAGILTNVEKRVTKKGKLWAKVTIEDLEAAIEVCFFPTTFEALGDELSQDLVCAIRGKLDARDGGNPQVIASDIKPLDLSTAKREAPREVKKPASRQKAPTQKAENSVPDETSTTSEPVIIRLPAARVTDELAQKLRTVISSHQGASELHIQLTGLQRSVTLRAGEKWRVAASTRFSEELSKVLDS